MPGRGPRLTVFPEVLPIGLGETPDQGPICDTGGLASEQLHVEQHRGQLSCASDLPQAVGSQILAIGRRRGIPRAGPSLEVAQNHEGVPPCRQAQVLGQVEERRPVTGFGDAPEPGGRSKGHSAGGSAWVPGRARRRSERSAQRVGSDLCTVAAIFGRGRGSAPYSPLPWLSTARRPPSVCHRRGGSRVAYWPANPRPAGRSLLCRSRKTLTQDITYGRVRPPGLNLFPRRLLRRVTSARANGSKELRSLLGPTVDLAHCRSTTLWRAIR